MCSELCKDFYIVYQLLMCGQLLSAGCDLFFFGLTFPNQRQCSASVHFHPGQPPLISTTSSATGAGHCKMLIIIIFILINFFKLILLDYHMPGFGPMSQQIRLIMHFITGRCQFGHTTTWLDIGSATNLMNAVNWYT